MVLNFDDSFDDQRTGAVVVRLGGRDGSLRLALTRMAVERAVSSVATGEVIDDGRTDVIFVHRESDCVAVPRGRGEARIDQLVGPRGSLRAQDERSDDELESADGPQESDLSLVPRHRPGGRAVDASALEGVQAFIVKRAPN